MSFVDDAVKQRVNTQGYLLYYARSVEASSAILYIYIVVLQERKMKIIVIL